MLEIITEEGIQKINQVYKDICIAENAYKNDIGGYNDAFYQRKIAVDDIFISLGLYGYTREIEDEVNTQVWTRTSSSDGRFKYEQVR